MRARHELRFGNREILFFSASFLVILGLSFALGVLVGRELSRQTLAGGEAPRVAQATPPPSKPDSKAAEPAQGRSSMSDKLTFYKSLTTPSPDVGVPASGGREYGVVSERIVPKGSSGAKLSTARTTAPRSTEVRLPEPPRPQPRHWTVQVSSFRSRALADELRSRLTNKGFDAYLVMVESDDGRVRYRVRVGNYPTRGEAERTAERLRAERDLNPFVTTRER